MAARKQEGGTARRSALLSDPRAVRSRELLREALLRLIQHRPFDKITLRDIAAEAGVSYPTLFNHYPDKDELFQDMVRQAIAELLAAFREGRAAPGWRPGRGITAYVATRRALWRILLTAGASDAMRGEFIRRGRELAEHATDLGHGVPIDVVSAVIAGGIFEIVAWWLADGAERDGDAIAGMLEQLVIEPALNLPRGYFAGR